MSRTTSPQKILVTGASGGIGSAIVSLLKETGHLVIPVDHSDADLSSAEETRRLAERILQKHRPLQWVVYAHGYIDTETDILKQSEENIARTFAINTLSVISLTQVLLSHVEAGIIYISSTAALSPNGKYAAYSASKAAVNAFAQALARGNQEIQSVVICPGPTATQMRQKVAGDAARHQPPEAVARVVCEVIGGSTTYKSGDIICVRDGKDELYRGL